MEGIFSPNIVDKSIQNQESQNYSPFNEALNFEEKFDDTKNKKPKKRKIQKIQFLSVKNVGKLIYLILLYILITKQNIQIISQTGREEDQKKKKN